MTDTAAAPTVLPEIRTSCSSKLDAEGWHAVVPVVVGDVGLGVRADSPDTEERLRALLAPWVAGGVEVDANYSVRLAPAERRRGARPLHLLYRSFVPIVRSRSRTDVADALLAHLSDLGAATARRHDLLRLRGAAFVADNAAVDVAPNELWTGYSRLQRRLEAAGRVAVNRPRVLLDPDGATAVVTAPTLRPPEGGYAAFDGGTWAPAPERRLPVRRWLVLLSHGGPPTRGRAVQLVAAGAENLAAVGWQRGLDGLARAMAGARCTTASGAEHLADALLAE